MSTEKKGLSKEDFFKRFSKLLNKHTAEIQEQNVPKNEKRFTAARRALNPDYKKNYIIYDELIDKYNYDHPNKLTKKGEIQVKVVQKIGEAITSKIPKSTRYNYESLYTNLQHIDEINNFFKVFEITPNDIKDYGTYLKNLKTSQDLIDGDTLDAYEQAIELEDQVENLKQQIAKKDEKIARRDKKIERRDRKINALIELQQKQEEELKQIQEKSETEKQNIKEYYEKKSGEETKKYEEEREKLIEGGNKIKKMYQERYTNELNKIKKETTDTTLKAKSEELTRKYDEIFNNRIKLLQTQKKEEYSEVVEGINERYKKNLTKETKKITDEYAPKINAAIKPKDYKGSLKQYKKDMEDEQKTKIDKLKNKADKALEEALAIAEKTKEITKEDEKTIFADVQKERKAEEEQIKQNIEKLVNDDKYEEVKERIKKALEDEMNQKINMYKEQINQKEAEFEELKKRNEEEQKQALNEIDAKLNESIEQINNLNTQIEEERKQAEEDKRTIKADANRDKNEKIAQIKHKMEERHEKDKEELLKEYQTNQKEIYGFAPNLEAYIKKKLASKAYSLDEDELIDKIARDIGKPGGLPTGTDPKLVAKAIYDRGAEETLKHIKKITNLAILTGYNNDLFNKLPGDVAQEVQKHITEKINDDIRKKNIKYILPKDKPRWEYAMQTKKLNPMLGRSAWRVN